MASSTPVPTERLAIGQLLVRLLHEFRADLLSAAAGAGYPDVRLAHLQIWGNVGIDGIRLTQLADRAQLSLAACSELVDDLQRLGYLERRADPADGRAKLIFPTARGRALLNDAGRRVADLEQRWSRSVGPQQFDQACSTLDTLCKMLEHP